MSKFELKYPELFQPIVIRNKVIKNRTVSSPHGDPRMFNVGEDGKAIFSEEAAIYYGNIARGGAAIVSTGHVGVDPRYYVGAHGEYADLFSGLFTNARVLPPMHRIVEQIHAYGSIASLELNHGGQWCRPVEEGQPLMGPSYLELENGLQVKEMDESDMEYVANCFADAAFLAKRAGFDMVLIHGGHNWLIGEFLSPLENRRTDQYGGSAENRARFPKMVLDRIRERIGEDMLIGMRISASENSTNGITIEDVSEIIDILSDTADIIQCSSGRIHDSFTEAFTFPSQYMKEGCNTYLAREIKKKERKCLIETVGGIDDPDFANELIRTGAADLVGMARAFIADPDWSNKALAGKKEDIRPCIRCVHCMDFCEPLDSSNSMSYCSVNPRRVFLKEPVPVTSDGSQKQVVVIGGGPAGMEAAIDIADHGHRVVLLERTQKLGGRLEFADYITFKDGVRSYRNYLIQQIQKRENVEVHLNTEATPEVVRQFEPDAIVVATGAYKVVPPITGVQCKNVVHAADIFNRFEEIGQNVVIIGGGDIGCEIAIQLQTMGKQVDLIEKEGKLMQHSKGFWEIKLFTEYFLTHEFRQDLKDFREAAEIDRVRIHLNAVCQEITEDGVSFLDANQQEQFVPADTVILATGLKTDWAKDNYDRLAEKVIYIGDKREPANIENATRTAYAASLQI